MLSPLLDIKDLNSNILVPAIKEITEFVMTSNIGIYAIEDIVNIIKLLYDQYAPKGTLLLSKEATRNSEIGMTTSEEGSNLKLYQAFDKFLIALASNTFENKFDGSGAVAARLSGTDVIGKFASDGFNPNRYLALSKELGYKYFNEKTEFNKDDGKLKFTVSKTQLLDNIDDLENALYTNGDKLDDRTPGIGIVKNDAPMATQIAAIKKALDAKGSDVINDINTQSTAGAKITTDPFETLKTNSSNKANINFIARVMEFMDGDKGPQSILKTNNPNRINLDNLGFTKLS